MHEKALRKECYAELSNCTHTRRITITNLQLKHSPLEKNFFTRREDPRYKEVQYVLLRVLGNILPLLSGICKYLFINNFLMQKITHH